MDGTMQLTYSASGDYLIPDLAAGAGPEPEPLTRYGILRRNHLKSHRTILYNSLLLGGTLHSHLLEIQAEAESRAEELMKRLLWKNPPPDKAADQMRWVAHMNSLRQAAEEAVRNEIIYS